MTEPAAKERVYDVYISLGANLGDRARAIRMALKALAALAGVELQAVSSLYETEPWGLREQPPFINAAAKAQASLPPLALLAACQEIELDLGRSRGTRWGARTIDIDLLHIPEVACKTPQLTLPHPYLTQRAFVLIPLAEIAPQLIIAGRSAVDWATAVEGRSGVQRWSAAPQI